MDGLPDSSICFCTGNFSNKLLLVFTLEFLKRAKGLYQVMFCTVIISRFFRCHAGLLLSNLSKHLRFFIIPIDKPSLRRVRHRCCTPYTKEHCWLCLCNKIVRFQMIYNSSGRIKPFCHSIAMEQLY